MTLTHPVGGPQISYYLRYFLVFIFLRVKLTYLFSSHPRQRTIKIIYLKKKKDDIFGIMLKNE